MAAYSPVDLDAFESVHPQVPVPASLPLQAVHAGDVARAIDAIVERPVAGAFNLAGDGVLDPAGLAEVMEARPLKLPGVVAATVMDAAWSLRP